MAYVGYAGQASGGTPGTTRSMAPDPNQSLGTAAPGAIQRSGGQTDILNSIYGQWNSAVGLPNQMLTQAQINQLGNQRDLTQMQGGLQSQNAQQQAGFALQNLGLEGQGLGVQQGALARQMALLPQQYGLQQQQFGIQGKQLDLSQTEAWQNAAQSQRGLQGQATSSGTWNMPGTSQGYADIKTKLQDAMTGIGLNRQSLGVSEQQAALGFHEQQAQQQDASKMLDIQSQKLGISGDEIRSRLQNQLDQIGIGTQVSVDQLLAEMYKTQQGGLSAFAPLFGTMASAQGIVIPGAQ